MSDPSCTAKEAVARGISALALGGIYLLGTGDYLPRNGQDLPFTPNANGMMGSDCAGFAICWAWKLRRHRPGFNRASGAAATVVDDINCNSALEDGAHAKELFVTGITLPQPGDLIMYPTIVLAGHTFIGHVGLVESVPTNYAPGEGWQRLGIIQCHGPNGFHPAVVESDGSIWDHHDHVWPKAEHRTQCVRPRERNG